MSFFELIMARGQGLVSDLVVVVETRSVGVTTALDTDEHVPLTIVDPVATTELPKVVVDDEVADFEIPTMESIYVDARAILVDVLHLLRGPIDSLVVDSGPIRAQLAEILGLLPPRIMEDVTPRTYLEVHRLHFEKL
ncbi:hypothetical protein GUJ93_ZPchr0008g11746 [Zizania palustris]|uniref:DUF1409 domain-containing protein n=1 Tax=Zizania palustris TaxID=103762 RepID=A0A8J5RK23_ZIZPA|nr:hypothetical protein GUJ93_ZPchr0008g11746 [Zizania palustris]